MRNNKITIASLVLITIIAITQNSHAAYADSAVIVPGASHSAPACTDSNQICYGYGATWRYYTWPEGANSVTLKGYGTDAQLGKTLTLKNCKAEGGYYRYGMVAKNTKNGFEKGQQVGVIGVNGNSSTQYNSVFFRSSKYSMTYRSRDYLYYRVRGNESVITRVENPERNNTYEQDNLEWDEVEAIYNYLREKNNHSGDFAKAWGKTTLAVFCGAPPDTIDEEISEGQTFYSRSTASNDTTLQTTGSHSSTGIVSEEDAVYTDRIVVSVGESVNISFSHDVYSDKSGKEADWQVARNATYNGVPQLGFQSNNGVSVSATTSFPYSTGYANATTTGDTITSASTDASGYYPGAQDYSDNLGGHTIRDFYSIYLAKKGVYEFCESIAVSEDDVASSAPLSRACTSIEAKDTYSYDNTPSFDLETPTAYAGETVQINDVEVDVSKRPDALDPGYAGKVESAKVSVVAYIHEYGPDNNGARTVSSPISADPCYFMSGSRLCQVVNTTDTTLNPTGSTTGSTDTVSSLNGTYNVMDGNAGDYMCYAVALYPSRSASAIDYGSSPAGEGTWDITAPQCVVIAKRPSFWVTGGGFYTSGSVTASVPKKTNVHGFYAYSDTGKGNTTVFGSMTEYNTLALGAVSGLASGSSVGYAKKAGHPETGSFEGTQENYCNRRTPLSMANYGASTVCKSVAVSGFLGIDPKDVDKDSLVDYWAKGTENVSGGATVDLNNSTQYQTVTNAAGITSRLTYAGAGGLKLSASTVPTGVTHVVRSSGNITINGDIQYVDTANITSLREIPKVIIYANNIIIDCSVSRVDAVLIAKRNITTCNNTDINSATNAKQLKINGSIIADTLTLNRTYGSAAGSHSGTPAEIINYDPSLLPWVRYLSGTTTSGSATVVYQSELAPRY